jgi:hypothetical protein
VHPEELSAQEHGPSHSQATKWQRVVHVLQKNYQSPDIEAARLVCAAVAAHSLKEFPPTWALAIAPPGSMKTDLLEGLRGLPNVHFVDEITTKTFISGKVDDFAKKRSKPASWLHRIGSDGIVVAADFSTFTADQKSLQVILAQMRRIYDGNYAREFGTDENQDERSWKGRLTLFAGAVPDIDRYYHLFQSLGERFLRVRWPRAGGIAAGLSAMEHTSDLAERLRAAMHSLLLPILTEHLPAPTLDERMKVRIASLSELIALGRSHVERDGHDREVVGVPITEGNTRLPQQLVQIGRGSSLLDGRGRVEDSDFALVCRAAFDSLPPVRRAVLEALIDGRSAYSADQPSVMVGRAIEDLNLVGVAALAGKGEQATLTKAAGRLVAEAGLPKPK